MRDKIHVSKMLLRLHISNITLIYVLVLMFLSIVGAGGMFFFLTATLIYFIFIFKEYIFFKESIKERKGANVAEKVLKPEYARKIRKAASAK